MIDLSSKRFSVIGGGIAGLTVARELALRGARVSVYERGKVSVRAPEGPATPGSIGVLTAPRRGRSPLRRLLAAAYRFYPEFVREVEKDSDASAGMEVRGSLHLVPRLPPPNVRARREAVYLEAGLSCRWAEGEELASLLAGGSRGYPAALYIPEEAVVDPRSLSLCLLRSCKALGVEIWEDCGEVRISNPEAPQLEVPGSVPIGGTILVIAAGCWSGEIARRLDPARGPDRLPVRPVRGQAIEVRLRWDRGPNLRFRPPGMERDYHIVARGRGRAWVGSTVETVGFDPSVTESGIRELVRAARAVFPEIEEGDVVEAWAGLRPQAGVRGGPFVGPLPGARDVWVHAGHYRSGILLCPLTARLLARMIAGEEDALEREGFGKETLAALAVDRKESPEEGP